MFGRLKQGYRYFFENFDYCNNIEVKNFLSDKEFYIFSKMDEYDKIHSYTIYTNCKKNSILKNDPLYLKLALLHDCGKENVNFFRRIKKVLIGDKILEQHSQIAFEKLKNINFELAVLCEQHHNKQADEKMKIFQKIDDE